MVLRHHKPAAKQRDDLTCATRIPQFRNEDAECMFSNGRIRQAANGLKDVAGQWTISDLVDGVGPVDRLVLPGGGAVSTPKRFNKGPGAWRAHKGLSV